MGLEKKREEEAEKLERGERRRRVEVRWEKGVQGKKGEGL